jgi:hypothetical protein
LGRWDPVTKKITEYQDAYLPGKEGQEEGGSRHTVRIDPKGIVWASGYPLTRYDPATGKYKDFPEAEHTYSLEFDKAGNVWFTNPGTGQIGEVDAETLKVTQWMPPTKDTYERRIRIDTDGAVRRIPEGKDRPLRSENSDVQGIRFARGRKVLPVRAWYRRGSWHLVLLVLSGCDWSSRSADREGDRISVSAFRKYDAGILSRFGGTNVVRVAVQQ